MDNYCDLCAHNSKQPSEYPCAACASRYNGQPSRYEPMRDHLKPITVADGVRSMDDESLARLIVEAQLTMLELALQDFGIEFSFPEEGKESAVAAALKKLQQPWEEA